MTTPTDTPETDALIAEWWSRANHLPDDLTLAQMKTELMEFSKETGGLARSLELRLTAAQADYAAATARAERAEKEIQRERQAQHKATLRPGGYYLNGRGDALGPMDERTPGVFLDQFWRLYRPDGTQWDHAPDSTGNIVLDAALSGEAHG